MTNTKKKKISLEEVRKEKRSKNRWNIENKKQDVDSHPIISITTSTRSRPNSPMKRQELPDKIKRKSQMDHKIVI